MADEVFHTAEYGSVAVLVPCYNEALTIAAVVTRAKRALPGAQIHVFDNNSSDDTVAVARAAGAIVTKEGYQGKANVVRRMFADVDFSVAPRPKICLNGIECPRSSAGGFRFLFHSSVHP